MTRKISVKKMSKAPKKNRDFLNFLAFTIAYFFIEEEVYSDRRGGWFIAFRARGILLEVDAGAWKMKVIAGVQVGLLKEL